MEQIPGIEGPPPVLAALDTVARLLDELDSGSAWRCGDAEVAEALDAAYRLTTRLHATALLMLAEADSRGLAQAAGASSLPAWLRARQLMRPAHSKRDVALARLIPVKQPEADVADGEQGSRARRSERRSLAGSSRSSTPVAS